MLYPPTEFEIFGLTFHLYGLIVGLSLLIGITLAEKIQAKVGYSNSDFWRLVFVVMLGGFLGARVWHVMTDWHLYVNNWLASLYVWQGGMSILGAVVGGLVSVLIYDRWRAKRHSPSSAQPTQRQLPLLVFLDSVAIALPFAHAVGRLANWLNQELFGPPTNLPWGIPIQIEFRPVEFIAFTHFHPLFLYELLLNLVIGGILMAIFLKNNRSTSAKNNQKVRFAEKSASRAAEKFGNSKNSNQSTWMQKFLLGSGNYFIMYLFLYSAVRFGLDFIRVEKPVILGGVLGFNQLVLLCVMILTGWLLWKRVAQKNQNGF